MRSLPKAKTLGQGSEPFREDPHDVVAATTELTSHSKERGNVAEVHDRTHRDSRRVADGRGPTAGEGHAPLTGRRRDRSASGGDCVVISGTASAEVASPPMRTRSHTRS